MLQWLVLQPGHMVFRKSVSFFILVALLWVLLWSVIPDASPDRFSFTDVLRFLPLLFSFMACTIALVILVIRYWGVDIISNLFPQTRLALWLGQHAYQFSQPATSLHIRYLGPDENISLKVFSHRVKHNLNMSAGEKQVLPLGHIRDNPRLRWRGSSGVQSEQVLLIKHDLKKFGKNLEISVLIDGSEAHIETIE